MLKSVFSFKEGGGVVTSSSPTCVATLWNANLQFETDCAENYLGRKHHANLFVY